jgi:tetratricopeptide (TPR) repeat protein
VSRPTERLIWLDIGPTIDRLNSSLHFLHRTSPTLSALTPAALLKSLQEENLDLDERIQRCQEDARKYLTVRPDLAWSRAHQAVALLGKTGDLNAVIDPLTRKSAYLCLAEVCFALGMRKLQLSAELGNPDLLDEAARASRHAENPALVSILYQIADLYDDSGENEAQAALALVGELPAALPKLPAWVLLELGTEPNRWISMLERVDHNGVNAADCVRVLPPFYEAIQLPDAAERTARLRTNAVSRLVKARRFREVLAVLALLPERDYRFEAQCHQALENFAAAAAAYRAAGDLQGAIDCYRRVPDLAEALAAMKELKKPHAAESALEWVAAMQALASTRPHNFNRVIKPEEKQLLQGVLETAFGVQRKKSMKNAVAKKTVRTKKTPAAPHQAKRTSKKLS